MVRRGSWGRHFEDLEEQPDGSWIATGACKDLRRAAAFTALCPVCRAQSSSLGHLKTGTSRYCTRSTCLRHSTPSRIGRCSCVLAACGALSRQSPAPRRQATDGPSPSVTRGGLRCGTAGSWGKKPKCNIFRVWLRRRRVGRCACGEAGSSCSGAYKGGAAL